MAYEHVLFYPVKVHLRVGWNTLKDFQAIKNLDVDSIASKLLPHDSLAKWMEKKDNWCGTVKELRYFLKQKAEQELTRPHVVHALFVAAGDVQFINDVLLAGKIRSYTKGRIFSLYTALTRNTQCTSDYLALCIQYSFKVQVVALFWLPGTVPVWA